MRKNVMVTIFLSTHILFIDAMTLSFNKLFPRTWYEKGLNATIFAWHKIDSFSSIVSEKELSESLDVILGKCTFAHFCLEKMYEHKQYIINEDIVYFSSLIYLLENTLKIYTFEDENEDKLLCLNHIIGAIKGCLNIPSNINTK
jgi:hypothetical protein